MERYQLVVNYEKLQLDVRVNDMPVPLSKRGQGFTITIINNLLTGASNTLTVAVKPPHGETHPLPNASMHVDITVYPSQDTGNKDKDKGRVLYTYDWKMRDIHTPLPHLQEQFQTEPPSAPLSWQNAAKLDPAHLDKAGINAQAKRLYDAMQTKNVSETATLLAAEVHDQAAGFGLPLAALEADQREGYQEDFSQPNWHLGSIDYNTLEYSLYGGGRVVLVHTRDGRKVFTSTPGKDGSSVAFDLFLSEIHGQWVIIK